jgi:photosystem II stability/assembly factor-like uncharacterized protein
MKNLGLKYISLFVLGLSLIAIGCKKDHCENDKKDKDETGTDCGGLNCKPCDSCFDNIKNQDEEDVDCGGVCQPCKLKWKKTKETGAHLKAVDFNDGLAVAVGNDGAAFKSLDSGKTWTQISVGTADHLSNVHVLDASHFYISGPKDQIYISTDGSSVTKSSTGFLNDWEDIHFNDASTGLVCGNNNTIYRTIDGGKTWSLAFNKAGFRSSYFAFNFLNNNDAFCLGEFDLLSTTNGGKTWVLDGAFEVNATFKSFTDLHFKTTTDAYIVSDLGMFIFVPLAQKGEQWVNKQLKISGGKIDFLHETGLYTGRNDSKTQGKVLISFDGGARWEDQEVDLSVSYNDGCIIHKDLMLVVGDNGTILRRAK